MNNNYEDIKCILNFAIYIGMSLSLFRTSASVARLVLL